MKYSFLVLGLIWAMAVEAQTIQSDCATAEVKALMSPEIVAHFVKKGGLVTSDCAPVKGPGDGETLIATFVFNTSTGYESYLALFDRKGFSTKSVPVYKSPILGFDLFPLLVNQKYRHLFLHPSTDKSRLVVLLNVQTAPGTSRLSRWDYVFERKEFTEGPKAWMIEAGILPKIFDDSGVHRALLGTRAVEI